MSQPPLDLEDASLTRTLFHAPASAQQGIERVLSHRRGERPGAPNPRSYAARIGVAPSASEPSTSTQTYSTLASNNTMQSSAQGQGQGSSILERSPLQKLEVRLGDLSKEQKRARMQEAETRASRTSRTVAASSSQQTRSSKIRPDSSFFDDSDDTSLAKVSPSSPTGRPSARAIDSSSPGVIAPAAGPTRAAKSKPRIASFDAVASWQRTFGTMMTYEDAPQPIAELDVPPQRGDSAAAPASVEQPSLSKTFPFSAPWRRSSMPDPRGKADATAASHTSPGSPELRRYQQPPALADRPFAKPIVLPAELNDFGDPAATTPNTAWWEHKDSQSKTPPSRTKVRRPPSAFDNVSSHSRLETTRFQPPLLLKCGPLLRFTGIQDQGGGLDAQDEGLGSVKSSSEQSTRQFWTGSILIVTDDSLCSYSSPPSIRVFKQNMDLDYEKSTDMQSVEQDSLHARSDDPVTGQPKCSPTGETLYVRPVRDIDESHSSDLQHASSVFQPRTSVLNDDTVTTRISSTDGEKLGLFVEAAGHRLHAERGLTFWRFVLKVELGSQQRRIAYRINHGPAIGFWIPPLKESMNIMFHSCNGLSLNANAEQFAGVDPLWRDMLNKHQRRPFHVMLGGGDQIYNDAVMRDTEHFADWLQIKNPQLKNQTPFSVEMQEELESYYLDNYCEWFSQGLFGLANSQIPMVNVWDDHDIIDGFGSYPAHFMQTPTFSGIGAVAFKYYMLFQHHTIIDETEDNEPSWITGAEPGPYINQASRSLFLSLGHDVRLLALDCRTERTQSQVLNYKTWQKIFQRCYEEIELGKVKHLLIMSGVPLAYPRLNFLENILTSRVLDPFKALGRSGALGAVTQRLDGSAEVLDDLNDHWTAKTHKQERNWFVKQLQDLAADKSVRVTILSGDAHLAAIGRFSSQNKLGIARDHDHRYMPNIISSAIGNSPPPELIANMLNKRNKVHNLDEWTAEDMIPLFDQDVTGLPRSNKRMLPRRNWCAIKKFEGRMTPPQSPVLDSAKERPNFVQRSLSFRRSHHDSHDATVASKASSTPGSGIFRRLSFKSAARPATLSGAGTGAQGLAISGPQHTVNSLNISQDDGEASDLVATREQPNGADSAPGPKCHDGIADPTTSRTESFHRRPSQANRKLAQNDPTGRSGFIDLSGGLEISLHCELDPQDPRGHTVSYRLLVPALVCRPLAHDSNTLRAGAQQHIDYAQSTAGSSAAKLAASDASFSDDEETSEGRYHTPQMGSMQEEHRERVESPHEAQTDPDPGAKNQHWPQPRKQESSMSNHDAVSGVGPRAPSYVDSLPTSVRKRYMQFDRPETRNFSDTGRPSTSYDTTPLWDEQPSADRAGDGSDAHPQYSSPIRSRSLVDRLRRRFSVGRKPQRPGPVVPDLSDTQRQQEHEAGAQPSSQVDQTMALGPLTSHRLDDRLSFTQDFPSPSESSSPYIGPGHTWHDRGGLPLPRPITLAMSEKAAKQLGDVESFGSDWLNRQQNFSSERVAASKQTSRRQDRRVQ